MELWLLVNQSKKIINKSIFSKQSILISALDPYVKPTELYTKLHVLYQRVYPLIPLDKLLIYE